MVVWCGEIWWVNLLVATGAGPGFRRPVVIVQSNDFNTNAIQTIIIAIITSNLRLTNTPGNITLRQRETKLKQKSVINVSQIFTIDKSLLTEQMSVLHVDVQHRVNERLKIVLAL